MPSESNAVASPDTRTQLLPCRFLTLPLEVRQAIYRHLLVQPTSPVRSPRNLVSIPDYHVPDTPDKPTKNDTDRRTFTNEYRLCFRSTALDPLSTTRSETTPSQRRSQYKIRSGRFRNTCLDATYTCVNRSLDLDTGILKACRQTHAEAAAVLYGGGAYTFDFDTHVEACAPFLADLTPVSRAALRRLALVKKALPYDKHFDRCEWAAACDYIAVNLPGLTTLELAVVAGRPIMGATAGADLPRIDPEAMPDLIASREDMQWVADLLRIRTLRELRVTALVEHCPPPTSSTMAFFVSFSASVEFGFREYLTRQMVGDLPGGS